MPFTIIRQDITRMQTDAIVNAANTSLLMGGGVCGAIFGAAGPGRMQAACDKVSPVQTGGAVITSGFNLPARYVIHAVGPVYREWPAAKSEELLRSAYLESLRIAVENHCESIAFPLISSGIYGYPKAEALRVATGAIRDFLADHDMDVYLTVYDKASYEISRDLMGDVDRYINENYVAEHTVPRTSEESGSGMPLMKFEKSEAQTKSSETRRPEAQAVTFKGSAAAAGASDLGEVIGNLDEPFNAALLRLIDVSGMTDAEVCRKANIDRRLFSKIRTNRDYRPGKRTVLALAVALKLNLDETKSLLEKAGYALSHSQKFDVIVEYYILRGHYDIYEINEVLFKYDQPLLGAG